MHQPTLKLLAATGLAATALCQSALAENKVAFGLMDYQERGGRVHAVDGSLAIEHDIDTDRTLKLDLGYDALSGATPYWVQVPGYANEYQRGLARVAREKRRSMSASLLTRDADRHEYTLGLSHSAEPDYASTELSGQVLRWADDSHNRSWTLGVGLMRNVAIATANTNNSRDRNATTVSVQAGVTQVIDASTTAELSVYGARDSGYLSHHYLKIVREDPDTGAHVLADDTRPDQRRSGGLALRVTRSLKPGLVGSLWTRVYQDSWSVSGLTTEARVHWDITPAWRLAPVLRVHRQTAAEFWRAYDGSPNTFAATGPGSNDERLGDMTALTRQINVQYTASKEWSFNAGVGHYRQSRGFSARTLTAGLAYSY
ncbi:DUF3570 domain-containing protein [Pseudaquabacterium rugosum]|jgi:hypothetical protein|uniref:DUF3570 domain-containing protein n=1 Tax=Pseudaquabacterium rugosum TaxID=2984194 RepID=A0ABU9B9R7_9BURK